MSSLRTVKVRIVTGLIQAMAICRQPGCKHGSDAGELKCSPWIMLCTFHRALKDSAYIRHGNVLIQPCCRNPAVQILEKQMRLSSRVSALYLLCYLLYPVFLYSYIALNIFGVIGRATYASHAWLWLSMQLIVAAHYCRRWWHHLLGSASVLLLSDAAYDCRRW